MISPPKKCLLALEAVLYVACRSGAEPVSSKDISKELGFPVRYLEQLMQKLVRDGVLRGIRGPRGGYVLARDRRHITIRQICDSLNKMEDTETCPPFGSSLGMKVIQPMISKAFDAMLREMNNITLEDLYQEAKRKAIDTPASPSDNNYTI